AEDGIRDATVTGVQTCALPILATLIKLLGMLPKDAIIVPGHGEPTDVSAIEYPIHYLEELRKQVAASVAQGLSEEQTVQRLSERSEERRVGKECKPGWNQ